jgi:hypothetical protein
MKRALFLLALPLAVAGCGLREPLEPAPGQILPPAPAMANRPLTSEELLAVPPIGRPNRVDELLRRSEERQDDRFDLPPGDIPVEGNSSAEPE